MASSPTRPVSETSGPPQIAPPAKSRYIEIRPLSREERFERCAYWPVYIPRIYFAIRRSSIRCNIKGGRRRDWGFARRWFHAWVWGYADLPF